jgi:hypothetical protein
VTSRTLGRWDLPDFAAVPPVVVPAIKGLARKYADPRQTSTGLIITCLTGITGALLGG